VFFDAPAGGPDLKKARASIRKRAHTALSDSSAFAFVSISPAMLPGGSTESIDNGMRTKE
jgi:hypothetical protein